MPTNRTSLRTADKATTQHLNGRTLISALADQRKIIEWNMARGLVYFETKQPYGGSDCKDLSAALLHMLEQDYEQQIIVIRDAHLGLRDNPMEVARLKALATQILSRAEAHVTIFLVAPLVLIPVELEKLVTLFDLPLPDEAAILEIIQTEVSGFKNRCNPMI